MLPLSYWWDICILDLKTFSSKWQQINCLGEEKEEAVRKVLTLKKKIFTCNFFLRVCNKMEQWHLKHTQHLRRGNGRDEEERGERKAAKKQKRDLEEQPTGLERAKQRECGADSRETRATGAGYEEVSGYSCNIWPNKVSAGPTVMCIGQQQEIANSASLPTSTWILLKQNK